MDMCVKCGMPVEEESKCTCDPSLCFHCCECAQDCTCGCSNMIDELEDEDEDLLGTEEDSDDEEEEI